MFQRRFQSYSLALSALEKLKKTIDKNDICTIAEWYTICGVHNPYGKKSYRYGYLYANHTKIKKDEKGWFVDLNDPVALTRKTDK